VKTQLISAIILFAGVITTGVLGILNLSTNIVIVLATTIITVGIVCLALNLNEINSSQKERAEMLKKEMEMLEWKLELLRKALKENK